MLMILWPCVTVNSPNEPEMVLNVPNRLKGPLIFGEVVGTPLGGEEFGGGARNEFGGHKNFPADDRRR